MNVTIILARSTDVMPPLPIEKNYNPSVVDLLLIKRLIAETSKRNLIKVILHEFVNISKSYANRLIGEMGAFSLERNRKMESASFRLL